MTWIPRRPIAGGAFLSDFEYLSIMSDSAKLRERAWHIRMLGEKISDFEAGQQLKAMAQQLEAQANEMDACPSDLSASASLRPLAGSDKEPLERGR